MPSSLAIGDFSRATHLNIKTLRHYHRIGLLEPAHVDPDTGHRRYGTDQIPTAQVIRRFRSLDMPLEEIHAVITTPDLAARNELIAGHLRRLETTLARTQEAAASLRDLLEPPAARHRSLSSTAGYRPRPPQPSARSSTSTRPAPGTRARSASCTPSWPLTRSRPPAPQAASTPTTCSPTNAARPRPSCPAARTGAGDRAGNRTGGTRSRARRHRACRRPYRRGPAYGSLATYVTDHALAVEGPIREYYVIGPHETRDEDQWRTEIGWPIFHTGQAGDRAEASAPRND